MLKYEFTRLLTQDFKAMYRFYRDILGFTPGIGDENDVYADFQLGAVNFSLFDRALMSAALATENLPEPGAARDRLCLIFAVENVDAFCEHLRAHNIALTAAPTNRPEWGIRTAHFRDPDGNLLEINQPLSAPADE